MWKDKSQELLSTEEAGCFGGRERGGEEEGEESFEDITRKGGNVRDDVSERVGATHKKPWERMVKRRKRRRRRREFNCIFNCWAETW